MTEFEVDWTQPVWEVFVRSARGLHHVHVGSLHAPDAKLALSHARDLFLRRQEGVSLWVVPTSEIVANDPDLRDAWVHAQDDKRYRHVEFYEVPDGVGHL